MSTGMSQSANVDSGQAHATKPSLDEAKNSGKQEKQRKKRDPNRKTSKSSRKKRKRNAEILISASTDNRKVPATVLTGFLGAGKTTLLNHILNSSEHGMRFAIIENELGEQTIDDKVLSKKTDERIVEVTNGCLCCNVRGDLTEALNDLHKKVESFDGIIIETTGLADPGPVAQTFFMDEEIKEKYRLDSIITVVDAKHILQHLNQKKPKGIVNEAQEQLAYADRVLLNKIDLVPDSKVLGMIEAAIKRINPEAPILRCQNSQVDPKQLIGVDTFDLKRALQIDPDFLTDEQFIKHDSQVSSCSTKFSGELNLFRFKSWIGKLVHKIGEDLFRYKGVIAVKGKKEKYVFQGVHMLFRGGFEEYDAAWKDGETRECRFVFIGKNLDKSGLIEGFLACKAEENLRFQVGDTVETRVGRFWKVGKILKLWDSGNPYKIEIEGRKKAVFGPVDNSKFVRLPGQPSPPREKQDHSHDGHSHDDHGHVGHAHHHHHGH